jgi:RecA/RadA recombinase
MSLFNKYKKEISKVNGISIGDGIPKFWIDTGSYVLNKIMSGSYKKGIPQGRLTALTGPSGSGKSFIMGNIIKSAQKQGCSVLIIDTENALDFDYLRAIGVNVDAENFLRITTNEVNTCTTAINTILKMYRDGEAGEDPDKLLICLDSLDFLFTNSALETYEKSGELNNDQGLHAKKLKQLLVTVMQDIQDMPVAMVATKQVYVDQTPNAFPPFKMTESLKFPFSQIVLLSRLFDRDKTTRQIDGIRMKAFGWKVRFTKPFQQVELTVPYDVGLDPYDGILQAAESLGIVTKNGAWYTYNGTKFQSSKFKDIQESVLQDLIKRERESLIVKIDAEEVIPDVKESDIKKQKLEETMFATASTSIDELGN